MSFKKTQANVVIFEHILIPLHNKITIKKETAKTNAHTHIHTKPHTHTHLNITNFS